MHTFEDVAKSNNTDLMRVLNEISDNKLLATALKSVKEDVRFHFFQAMPSLRREIVMEEIDRKLDSLSEITMAQNHIVEIVNKIF